VKRCEWANKSEIGQAYHDNEWGVPSHDDRHLFEMLILEGAQAGLSWSTILRKREGYKKAFDNFDARTISRYSEADVTRLLANPEIVRNRLKIVATVINARAFLRVQEEFGSFDHYIWQFVNGRTIRNSWKKTTDIPSSSPESDAMSKDLRKRGFKFRDDDLLCLYAGSRHCKRSRHRVLQTQGNRWACRKQEESNPYS
jgi:DNA-3-methyladenine glycosylase I